MNKKYFFLYPPAAVPGIWSIIASTTLAARTSKVLSQSQVKQIRIIHRFSRESSGLLKQQAEKLGEISQEFSENLGKRFMNRVAILIQQLVRNVERDSMRDFFDPTPEAQNVVLIGAATVRKAERLVVACEACSAEDAQLPFDNVLDRIASHNPAVTDYILEEPAKCPRCKQPISEKTLVEFSED